MRFEYDCQLNRPRCAPIRRFSWTCLSRASAYAATDPAAIMRQTLLDLAKSRFGGAKKTAEPTIPLAAAPDRATVPKLVAEPWYVDHIDISGNRLSASGWSMPVDMQNMPVMGWFSVNNRPFDELRYPFPRPDVGEVFWMREGSGLSGFEGAIENILDPYPNGILEIRRIRTDTLPIERGRDSWFKPDPARHTDLPDSDRRFRVIADRDANAFLVSGATDFHRIDRAVVAVSDRHLHEFNRVLDWGVGCGRVARHFPSERAGSLTGIDIDPDNVEWCASHLVGTFVPCRMAPPLPFEDGGFDLIYGVSVFTHLREAMQFRWLEELSRIMARGALSIDDDSWADRNRLLPQPSARVLALASGAKAEGDRVHGRQFATRRPC